MKIAALEIKQGGPVDPVPTYEIISDDDGQENPAANRDWGAIKTALGLIVDSFAQGAAADTEALVLVVTLDECRNHEFTLELEPETEPAPKVRELKVLPRRPVRIVEVLPRKAGG